MTQVEIFTDSDAGQIEAKVNAWLKKRADEIIIKQILQSESFDELWSLTLTVVYVERNP